MGVVNPLMLETWGTVKSGNLELSPNLYGTVYILHNKLFKFHSPNNPSSFETINVL
jgi:hypothetical protein